jgi:hypothetical protein
MGMTTHIVGYRSADDKWEKMKTIYNLCEEALIEVPEEVYQFFDYKRPGDKPGMEVEIEDHESVSEWSDVGKSGYEIDVELLPKDVKVIRVYNSW